MQSAASTCRLPNWLRGYDVDEWNSAGHRAARQQDGGIKLDQKQAGQVISNAFSTPRTTLPVQLMRVSEAAALIGVHPETLRRRIRRGELPAYGKPPRRVAVEDLLEPYKPGACKK